MFWNLSRDFAFDKVVMRLETYNVRASSSDGIFQVMVIKIAMVLWVLHGLLLGVLLVCTKDGHLFGSQ
jgi:ABC-type methionine transport system permease subunit